MILFTSRMNNDPLIELSPANAKLKKSSTLYSSVHDATVALINVRTSSQQTVCRYSEKTPAMGRSRTESVSAAIHTFDT